MRFSTAGNLLIGALAAMTLLPDATEAKTCLMLYQMADNNLEYFIRQDFQELSQSAVIKSGDLRTWIYYDALNQGGQALPNTVDSNGNGISSGFTGSRYVTYDSGLQKMKVDVELPGEQNSDTTSAVQSFLEHAMTDCKNNGYDSLMAVFASHGGGFAGYGGDENGRKLLQTNQGVAAAIRGALDNTGSGPTLDVLGFDACLMQAVGAADDYKYVTKYILASEAVEPGHGWAYNYLDKASTALELAQNMLETFLTQTQGSNYHQAPKTMAILDVAKFDTFINAFEMFSGTLLNLLRAGDTSLHSFVSRARSSSVAFEGVVDAVGSQNPSGLDIGSFLNKFAELCAPGEPLESSLNTAIASYAAMFVAEGVGPGTSPGTGMHITWPNQGEYSSNPALWNEILFNNGNYVTAIIPNFRAFLQFFLPSGSQGQGGNSVCGIGAGVPPAAAVTNPNALIQKDSGVIDSTTGMFNVDTTISPDVSQMLVEYGIDLSSPLKPLLESKGYVPTDDEYLILLGGDVAGTYEGSGFSASWDQQFYFLNITGTDQFEALYVFDQGDGSKKIPAMYFPKELKEAVSELQFLDYLFFDFDKWVEKGARFSFLKFSVDEADGRVNDNLSLFTSNEAGVFAEMPRSQGGMMIPLIYIDAYIQGNKLDTLPGGFNQTVIQWSADLEYNILTTPVANIFTYIEDTDAVVLNVYAFNHADPSAAVDVKFYDVRRDRGTKPNLTALGASTSDENLETSSACIARLGFVAGLGMFLVSLMYA